MIAIHQLTRFLAGLGEIVNILTAPILAALVYLAAMERFMGVYPPVHQDIAIFTSIFIAVVAVGFINGGFAVLFAIKRLVADKQGQTDLQTTSQNNAKPQNNAKTQKSSQKNSISDQAASSKPKPKTKTKAQPKAAASSGQ